MQVKELFTYRAFTLSNLLSMMRVLLVPVIWHYIARIPTQSDARYYAVGIASFMVATDFLDGYLAILSSTDNRDVTIRFQHLCDTPAEKS